MTGQFYIETIKKYIERNCFIIFEINLDDLAGGELGVQFQAAAKKVVENLLDPNTPYKNKRRITIKLTFEQNEERNDVVVGVSVESKLAPRTPMKTNLAIGKDLRTNDLYVQEYGRGIKGQASLEDYPKDNAGNILIDDKKVDESTGEVLN